MVLKSKEKIEMLVDVAYNHHKHTGQPLETSYVIKPKNFKIMLDKLEELLNNDKQMDNIALVNLHNDYSAGLDGFNSCYLEFKWGKS